MKKTNAGAAVMLAEEGWHLLSALPWRSHGYYALSCLPFLSLFAFFWTDNARNARAADYLWEMSVLMMLAYLWMKCWQSRYTHEMKCLLTGQERAWWRPHWRRACMNHAIWSVHAFWLLPLAVLAVLPLGWVLAFFQNLSYTLSSQESRKEAVSEAWAQAKQEPMEALMISVFLKGLCLVVWLNVLSLVSFLNYLLYRLLAWDTLVTRDHFYFLRDPFYWVFTLLLTYCLLNPWLKAVFAIRCFRWGSRRTGQDLRVAWQRSQRVASLVLLTLVLFGGAAVSSVEAAQGEAWDEAAVTQWVEGQVQQSKYAWQLPPHLSPVEGGDSWLRLPWLRSALEALGRWGSDVWAWLEDVLEDWFAANPEPNLPDSSWMSFGALSGALKVFAYVLLGVLVLGIVFLLLRNYRRGDAAVVSAVAMSATADIDLEDEAVSAELLLDEQWWAMAYQLWEEGKHALAMRAFFLGYLSCLGRQGRLSIKQYKTNQEYVYELSRIAHRHPELLTRLQAAVALFEGHWYGHLVAGEDTLRRCEELMVEREAS